MSRWTSRWFGARFVMTAMCGLRSIVMSWKLDSSSTAQSVCAISPASHSSGWPMLPPTWTVFPAARSSSAMIVVVVVLPSDPVTAMIGQGQTWKNSSISEVKTLPRATASRSCGTSGRRPGVRKITSCVRFSRYPSPSCSAAPAPSSSPASSPRSARLRRSQAVTEIPSRQSSFTSGVLLTPIPITATVLPRRESRYARIFISACLLYKYRLWNCIMG